MKPTLSRHSAVRGRTLTTAWVHHCSRKPASPRPTESMPKPPPRKSLGDEEKRGAGYEVPLTTPAEDAHYDRTAKTERDYDSVTNPSNDYEELRTQEQERSERGAVYERASFRRCALAYLTSGLTYPRPCPQRYFLTLVGRRGQRVRLCCHSAEVAGRRHANAQ